MTKRIGGSALSLASRRVASFEAYLTRPGQSRHAGLSLGPAAPETGNRYPPCAAFTPLAIGRQGSKVPAEFQNLTAYEKHPNGHDRSRSAGAHLHRQSRAVPRGRLARGWLLWRRLPRRWL